MPNRRPQGESPSVISIDQRISPTTPRTISTSSHAAKCKLCANPLIWPAPYFVLTGCIGLETCQQTPQRLYYHPHIIFYNPEKSSRCYWTVKAVTCLLAKLSLNRACELLEFCADGIVTVIVHVSVLSLVVLVVETEQELLVVMLAPLSILLLTFSTCAEVVVPAIRDHSPLTSAR